METLKYTSIAELVNVATERGELISQIVLRDQAEQMDVEPKVLFQKMRSNYQVMRESIQKGTDPDIRSTSGLTGGDAYKLYQVYEHRKSLTGSFMSGAIWRALAVSELNAAMGRIVAAPTAGSCGILPAAIVTMQEEYNLDEYDCVMALFTASAIGMVIGNNASLAGASGGCQAECGSPQAQGGSHYTVKAVNHANLSVESGEAVAIAIKNILGLVCDPVAGLVEIPCIKRNAGGVTTAFMAAEVALAGITSHIPADETILAMKRIGDTMPATLRETAEGGLAMTPTGQKLNTLVFGENADAASCSSCRACR